MADEVIEYIAKRYRCTWCLKSWAARPGVEKHLLVCWYRPANRGCKTCVHFVPAEPYYSRDEPGGPEYCAKGISLISPYALRNIVGELQTEPKILCGHWEENPDAGATTPVD